MAATNSYPIEKPLEGLESFYVEFLTNRENELRELQTALANSNFTAIAEIAHRWKGFCEPYGFGQLGNIAKELEVHAKASEAAPCQKILVSVSDYLAHKRTTLP